MPVTTMLEADRVIRRPRHDMRSPGRHHLVAAGTPIVLLGCGSGDLAYVPVAIRVALTPLASQRIQRSLVVAPIGDPPVFAPHG